MELIEGDALDALDELTGSRAGGFDLIFLDANKKQYSTYFTRIMEKELLRVGGVRKRRQVEAGEEGEG